MKRRIILILSIFVYSITYAQASISLAISDTRSVNDLPNFFDHGIRADFKERSAIGVPGEGFYSTNLTIAQWDNGNNSGGKHHQLNFNNGGFFYRNANPLDAQWGIWRQILMTGENGNVSISTTNSTEKLNVNGNINISGIADRRLFMGGAVGSTFGIAYDSTYPNYGIFYTEATPDYVSISPNGNAKDGVMNIFGNGYVGIGTTNPTSKLTVAGNINAREVKVTVDAGADFVFDKDYDLPSLASVDNYIKQNKHLPKIASATEMQTNGINLSEMNIKLLQKIEEMTLYMIDFKKQINSLKDENRVQQEEIETFKETKK